MLQYHADSPSNPKSYAGGFFNLQFASNTEPQERPVILFTDTEDDMLDLYRMLMRRMNYDTLYTTSSEEALHLCRTQRISLLVTDLNKPVMDGFELVARLRHDPYTAQIPVMIVSTVYLEPYEVEAADVDDYLQKPFNYEDLLQRIHTLVEASDPLQ